MPHWRDLRYLRAEEVIKKLGLKPNPTVDVLAITKTLGIPVFWNKTMQAQGRLWQDTERGLAEIHVAQGAPRDRFRFTVAHELAHLLLHDFDEPLHEDFHDQPQTVKEREANSFAARLLIPTGQLLWFKQLAGGPFKQEHIKELALLFRVSENTMFYRVNNLDWIDPSLKIVPSQ